MIGKRKGKKRVKVKNWFKGKRAAAVSEIGSIHTVEAVLKIGFVTFKKIKIKKNLKTENFEDFGSGRIRGRHNLRMVMVVYWVYDTTRAAIYPLDWPVATLPIPFRIRGGYVASTDNSLSVPKRDSGCQHARTPTHPGSMRRPMPWLGWPRVESQDSRVGSGWVFLSRSCSKYLTRTHECGPEISEGVIRLIDPESDT